ncbi:DUF1080 domain-containing protein [Aureibaculum algae]|uniref:DUF1080 domain-containing protein n=1 Tax=Aureibaculum algae TaxID=2584122 RepID=A0A5B7TQF1_9FLAO|nr:family 16 glycoside hydrolase [Aureibaculum algae]QCX37403.1 DUF1080 domain-containing protein [Aureibaculum algae]
MKIKLSVLFIFFSCSLFAQEQISLENLNDFKSQAGNWQIVGGVTVNRNIDAHHEEVKENISKRKKKKRKKASLKPIEFTEGTGIILNVNDENKNDALVTNWEHGDLKLELEVLLPKGSNSGIYFQGRYEFQLRDSWDVKNPLGSDMGGFHNNWESAPDKIFRGIPPMSNAAKAPGLWQKIKVNFQAPRFNEAGQKISNAKFISVDLNGVRIHSNVEVPTYTGGPIDKNEVAKGPLLIQGNHGPVAIRNFKYQLLKDSSAELTRLSYRVYKGNFKQLEDLENQMAVESGTSEKIDINVVRKEDEYGLIYSGNLQINEADTYDLSFGYTGGLKVVLDGKTLTKNNSSDSQSGLRETVMLTKGNHTIEITNIKSAAWRSPRLGFTIESASTNIKEFHVLDSYPSGVTTVAPIFVDAEAAPRMLRAFVDFKGNGKRLSHTIGVGTPTGVNFIYDLGAANLVGMWRGDFVDATPMWHERGNGSFNPRGAVNWTFLNQPIAQLETVNSPFPGTGVASNFVSKGYKIDKANGLPIFKSEYNGVAIEN